MNLNQAPNASEALIEKGNPASTIKKPLIQEEQKVLDAKYSVEKTKQQDSAFTELLPDESGNRRVEVNGKKYVLGEVFGDNDKSTGKYHITPYTISENGDIVYGKLLQDVQVLKDVMSHISPEMVQKNIDSATASLRRLSDRYDATTAWAVRKLFQESVGDEDQKKMAKDIFAASETRTLYDSFFSTPTGDPSPLKGSAFYRELFVLEDARLKEGGYPEGLSGSSI